MRETIFRGKDAKTGEWVFGDLNHHKNGKVYIRDWRPDADGAYAAVEVDPETVGQYTGMKDKNGKRIFEGDVIDMTGEEWDFPGFNHGGSPICEVKFDPLTGGFDPFATYVCDCACECGAFIHADGCRVVGNIHDNQDLTGEE